MASTPYVPSIAIDAVIVALGAFISPFVGGATIIRGQQNRVPPPADSYVKLTEGLKSPIETPSTSNPANGQVNILSPMRIDVQVDFYGPAASDWSTAVAGVYRTGYAVAQFPAGIAPLYASDPIQAPLTNAEQQYEQRWTMTASLQFNPVMYLPQQSATALSIDILDDVL